MTENTHSTDGTECSHSLSGLKCRRSAGHDGAHQASTSENDGHHDMQLVEWWSIKPNGDPIEGVSGMRSEDTVECIRCLDEGYVTRRYGTVGPGPAKIVKERPCPNCNIETGSE